MENSADFPPVETEQFRLPLVREIPISILNRIVDLHNGQIKGLAADQMRQIPPLYCEYQRGVAATCAVILSWIEDVPPKTYGKGQNWIKTPPMDNL